MINLALYIMILCLFISILLRLLIFNYARNRDKEKNSAFECGFDSSGATRLQFCMKFFLVGVVFLVFDVEVGLILPLPFSQVFVELFILILMGGLTYE